jgi:translation initiation factor 3 subunit E
MAEYDLTPVISSYLDRHLALPLLEFLDVRKVNSHLYFSTNILKKDLHSKKELLEAKLKLLEKTNLVDFAVEQYAKLHNTQEIPSGWWFKINSVV